MSRRRNIVIAVAIVVLVVLFLSFTRKGKGSRDERGRLDYIDTYPLRKTGVHGEYVIGVISDMDKKSKVPDQNKWKASLKIGRLTRDKDGGYSVTWEKEHEVTSELSVGGRGMELSCLVVFNNALYTCDDRSGVVFSLRESKDEEGFTAIPRYILSEGDGEVEKNLKCEWMSVKDGKLYVGGFGKEFVNSEDGSITSEGPMWVKIITTQGAIEHVDWREKYRALRKATKKEHPSYLLHESAHWNDERNRWFFLPRRVSDEPYDEKKDELMGSNLVLSAPESFKVSDIEMTRVGEIQDRARGFSAFRFVPDFPQEVVALRSVETGPKTETYIMVFNVDTGEILMPDTKFADIKYEGIEFM